jgi:hypothetical protein
VQQVCRQDRVVRSLCWQLQQQLRRQQQQVLWEGTQLAMALALVLL